MLLDTIFLLFFFQVIQSLSICPRLVVFVMNILSKLISKQVGVAIHWLYNICCIVAKVTVYANLYLHRISQQILSLGLNTQNVQLYNNNNNNTFFEQAMQNEKLHL